MHLNSTVSTNNAQYCTLDIKDFYLNSDLDEAEHVILGMCLIPDSFASEYNMNHIAKNGKVLTKIIKGMHGLKQAGKIACEDLKQHLQPYGYAPVTRAPGLWRACALT